MPVAGWGVGPQLPLSVTSAAHAGPKFLILSESFGVIIFLNNFKKITPEGLQNHFKRAFKIPYNQNQEA